MANDVSDCQLQVSYHRRLDRTPEKSFDAHAESDKIRICNIRKLTEKTKQKIDDLQDGIDDRDKTIEQERELRKAAEDKLKALLKDPYQNPEVNQELRERLPRANKTDPLLDRSHDSEDDLLQTEATNEIRVNTTHCANTEDSQGERTQNSEEFDISNIEAQIVQPNSSANTTNSATDPKKGVNMEVKGAKSEQELSGLSTSPSRLQIPNNIYGPTSLGAPGHQFTGSFMSPYMAPQMNFTSPYTGPFMNPTSLYSYNMVSPQAPLRNTANNTYTPVTQSESPQKASQLNATSKDSSGTSDMDVSMNVNDLKTSPQGKDNLTASAVQGSVPNPGNPDSPFLATSQSLGSSLLSPLTPGQMHSTHPSQPLYPMMASSGIGSDQSRQISFLLSELDAVKGQNKKLAEKLVQTERELEILQVERELGGTDISKETTATATAADLVQEVHAAQKKREESMMGRIKTANQERDEAVHKLREVERRLDEGYSDLADLSDTEDIEDDDVQEGIENLISQIDPFFVSNRKYTSLLKKLEMIKSRKREITIESMQTLIEERDMALAKARKLEEELQREQSRGSGIGDHHLRAQLAAIMQERNMALAENQHLKEEIQTIRIYYSLHKSLAQESLSNSQVNNTLKTYHSHLTDNGQKESNVLLDELRTMKIERDQMEADMDKMRNKLEESAKNTEKLNCLVAALRRKLKSDIAKAEAEANSK